MELKFKSKRKKLNKATIRMPFVLVKRLSFKHVYFHSFCISHSLLVLMSLTRFCIRKFSFVIIFCVVFCSSNYVNERFFLRVFFYYFVNNTWNNVVETLWSKKVELGMDLYCLLFPQVVSCTIIAQQTDIFLETDLENFFLPKTLSIIYLVGNCC